MFTKFKSVWFYLGVESGSQRILNKMRKGITVDQIVKAFDLCHKYNIKTTASIIFGSPTETKEELDQSLRLLKIIKPTRYTYCLYTPYPGSPWYDEIVSNKEFVPPRSMKEWSNFAVEIRGANLDKANLSAVPSKYLLSLDNKSWFKSLWQIMKEKEFHKIYLRLVNYEPFLIPLLDPIDKVMSR